MSDNTKSSSFSLFDLLKTRKSAGSSATYPEAITATCQAHVQDYISGIGNAQRIVADLEIKLNTAIAALLREYAIQALPHVEQIEALKAACEPWLTTHRADLLVGDRKSADLTTGTVCWRQGSTRITVRDEEAALEELTERGLELLIRTVREVNKAAIKANPDLLPSNIKHIKISQGKESLVITPALTKLDT